MNNGTASAAITARAGSQSASVSAAEELTRTVVYTFRGHSVEDNQNDPLYVSSYGLLARGFKEFFPKKWACCY